MYSNPLLGKSKQKNIYFLITFYVITLTGSSRKLLSWQQVTEEPFKQTSFSFSTDKIWRFFSDLLGFLQPNLGPM